MDRWKRKNVSKVIRTILELIGVIVMLIFIGNALFWEKEYIPYDESWVAEGEDNGFIVLSYFGVEKYESTSTTLIDEERLDEHLKALFDSGYVTISQQDVLDYYAGKKNLPPKSLFLIFEDGRRDTAIFAEEIMEKYNFCATMGTYAQNVVLTDSKFLSAKDIDNLKDNNFWEMAVNGYRLEYINIYDQFDNFFGHLNSNEFAEVSQYLVRDYDHYLMDFIRDEDHVPIESKEEMEERISYDYEQMKWIYESETGELPPFYVLMHSNTGAFGTNEHASAENAEHIYELFKANFNWEGNALNKISGENANSLYQLTRLQPQENWYTNHLLMRLEDETKQELAFAKGDEERSNNWQLVEGAAEFKANSIVLTSPVSGTGSIQLKDVELTDGSVEVELDGNIAGAQKIYLRADKELENAIGVYLVNNIISVAQVTDGIEKELYSLDLFEFDGGSKLSNPEVELQGLIQREEAILQYSQDEAELEEARQRLSELENMTAKSMEEGAEGYVPLIDLNDKGNRKLVVKLEGDYITLSVDGKDVVKNLKVQGETGELFYLGAAPLSADEKYSQRNLTDTVYDGVFTDLHITKDDKTIFSNKLTSGEKMKADMNNICEKVIIWFIENL